MLADANCVAVSCVTHGGSDVGPPGWNVLMMAFEPHVLVLAGEAAETEQKENDDQNRETEEKHRERERERENMHSCSADEKRVG